MKKYFLPLFIITLILSFNHASNAQNKASANAATTGANRKAAKGNALILKANSIYDQRAGMEAARLWIPKGWVMKSEVKWRTDNDHFPAGITLAITDPTGEIHYEAYPDQFYIYAPGPHYTPTNLGCKYINELPGAKKAIANYLIPAVHRNVQGLRIVEENTGAEHHDQGVTTIMVTALVEYTLNSKVYEEKMEATYTCVGAIWTITGSDGIRAPKGQLNDELMKLFKTIGSTLALNHDWETMYVEVRDRLIQQVDETSAAVRANSIITQRAFEHNRKVRQEGYDKMMQTKYDAAEHFDDHINGVEARHDLAGNVIKVEAGYEHKYISSHNDEVILTNDPLYDPNKDSRLNDTYSKLPP